MKKRRYIYLVLALSLALLLTGCGGNQAADDGAIVWKDSVIEAAFRDWLGKPEGSVYPDELDAVTRVSVLGDKFVINETPYSSIRELPSGERAYYPGGGTRTSLGHAASEITTLSDFANCRSLEELYLSSLALEELSGVTDLAGLESLTKLSVMGSANLRDIGGLSTLSNLTELWLCSIEPDSFNELADMERLEMLTIIDTNLESFEPVSAMQALRILYVEDVPATDAGLLADLDKLEILSYISDMPSIDFSLLAERDALMIYYESGDCVVIDSFGSAG